MKQRILLSIIPIVVGGMYTPFVNSGEIKHVVVYHEDDHFAGWPACEGAWQTSDDHLLVGFLRGDYKLKRHTHNIGGDQQSWLARSQDGGETWTAWDPENYVGDFGKIPQHKPLEQSIDFAHPRFALRIVGTAYHGAFDPRGHFFYTYDVGRTWNGPYGFGDLLNRSEIQQHGFGELTPRTDYIVLGKHEALLMVSVRYKGKFGSDKVLCVRSADGGRTFEPLSWVVPPDDSARAVMSHTVQLTGNNLVTCMRRRDGKDNWVDAYRSADNGKTWQFLAKVGDAGAGNGNPPAIAATADGRLCVVWGERTKGRIIAAYSRNAGETWGEPVILRHDFWSEDMETDDLGYARLFCRNDGKLIAIYYYSTKEALHSIQATIWEPDE